MVVKSPMTARRPIELQTRLTIFYLNFFFWWEWKYMYIPSPCLSSFTMYDYLFALNSHQINK